MRTQQRQTADMFRARLCVVKGGCALESSLRLSLLGYILCQVHPQREVEEHALHSGQTTLLPPASTDARRLLHQGDHKAHQDHWGCIRCVRCNCSSPWAAQTLDFCLLINRRFFGFAPAPDPVSPSDCQLSPTRSSVLRHYQPAGIHSTEHTRDDHCSG